MEHGTELLAHETQSAAPAAPRRIIAGAVVGQLHRGAGITDLYPFCCEACARERWCEVLRPLREQDLEDLGLAAPACACGQPLTEAMGPDRDAEPDQSIQNDGTCPECGDPFCGGCDQAEEPDRPALRSRVDDENDLPDEVEPARSMREER